MTSDTPDENNFAEKALKPVSNKISHLLKAGSSPTNGRSASPKARNGIGKRSNKDENALASGSDEPSSPTIKRQGSGVSELSEMDADKAIKGQTLGLFQSSPETTQAAQSLWKMFLGKYPSRDAAGEAIFQALFEAAPSLQPLFTSSKAVQAMKFMIAMNEIIMSMEKPESLQAFVETLGFQHLLFEITTVRAAIFRDAILDVIAFELADLVSEEAKRGLTAILNYVGGGLIYVSTHYAERIRIITESWGYATGVAGEAHLERQDSEELSSDGSGDFQINTQVVKTESIKSQGRWSHFRMLGRKSSPTDGTKANEDSESMENNKHSKEVEKQMPRTFSDMFAMNSAVMGMADNTWMAKVLEVFDALVANIANSARIKEECDVLALRLSKNDSGQTLDLSEFKACMLAALRSLLPKHWTSAHETAWTWMWDNVARLLVQNMGNLQRHEGAITAFFEGMDDAALYNMRRDFYKKFLEMAPTGQLYFKQSNTRLHFIAERISNMVLEVFSQPECMVADISAIGLRHVEFGIPTDLFAPFVSANVDVLCTITQDNDTLEAYRWSLGLISRILVRTINEGSTLVMRAINANSIKQVRQAIESAPRSARAEWFLHIQVGTKSISPLSWAVESGKHDVAAAIIKDLLTIRADRSNYYYGVTMLFTRHPHIIHHLVDDAPVLLPKLLDGLIWRSHRPQNGIRRVTYYVKHLMVEESGKFADALQWLAATGDPAIIAHPVVSMVSQTLWNGVVFRQFIVNKMWNVLSLIVFMLSQGIIPRMIKDELDGQERQNLNNIIFAGRSFTYILGMGRLAVFHLSRIWTWCRVTAKTIFDEIDEDGDGNLDWEELAAAGAAFKSRVGEEFKKAFKFLRDDDGPVVMDDARKGIAGQSKSMYNIISFVLMMVLAIMLTHEPMLWCTKAEDWPTAACEASQEISYRYSVLVCVALVIHWLILVDLAVFSTDISAFLLVVGHVMGEVKTFLTALSFLLLTFGSALPIFCSNCPLVAGNYSSMPRAMVSLFGITLGWFEADDVMQIRSSDSTFLAVLMLFVGLTVIILLNLLIAQLNRSYEYINKDMVGFAQMNRASLIVEAMLSCGKDKWEKFQESLMFDQKLEFDPGDLGLAGGIQVTEPKSEHAVLEETILRFGGSTAPDTPWPVEKTSTEDQDDRWDRLETLLQKAIKRRVGGETTSAQQDDSLNGSRNVRANSGSSSNNSD